MVRIAPHSLPLQHRIQLDDVELNVSEWGSPQADVTVVLTHGWTLSSRIWEDVAALLVGADPTLRVIAYDHRGHGSSTVASASIEQLADDLATVVGELVPTGPIVFGGHSLGGMTLMALAERHPEVITHRALGVAFVATSAGDLLGALRRFRGIEYLLAVGLILLGRVRTPSKPLFLARQGARGIFGKRPRRHDLNRAVQQTALSNPRTVAALGRSILQHNRYDALQALRDVDVVVLAGTRDKLTSPAHGRRIADLIPGSEVVIYQDAGHFLPYERREAIAAQLLNLTTKARALVARTASAVG
jgi:pimeloyl-ACP methyl ester carboxylesterase